ncbi:DUF2797 domain-containing protein [Kitasatospora camelliae]|uniref:DUF2797 domain-containing protein n=1 Tax=Kitasatospora camelliae TaxID=3156397 RepID=A0AAU8JR16_9ACTN
MGNWTATGVRWRDGVARLTASDGRREHERAVEPGLRVAWRLSGPRGCGGVWAGGRHRRCPYGAVVAPDSKTVQCEACQSADRGLALARDQILDDGRTYRLYLAWFGDGLLKVGLTAEERGTVRLQEQAALVYTFVGRGRLPAVRRAELTVARAGLARERVPSAAKSGAWWALPAAEHRAARLAALRAEVLALLAEHDVELLRDGPLVDQVALFGLAQGAPEAYREVTALAPDAVLGGTLRAAVGGHLFLDQAPAGSTEQEETPLLLDTRLLTGWGLTAVPAQPCAGVVVKPRLRPREEAEQESLF